MPNAETCQEVQLPLEMTDLDAAFEVFRSLERAVLAVSGGADSLALMVLLEEYRRKHDLPLKIHVASVDHGLRPDAAMECAYVKDLAASLGLPHRTLKWDGGDRSRNLQSEARKARYELLSAYAGTLDCRDLVVAHHRDDQAETFIMRLIRGSGVTGLGAMRRKTDLNEFCLHRPFLDIPKSRLVASLKVRDVRWIEDPSNQKDDFLRVRVRGLMPHLAKEGCDGARLSATARRLRRADDALDAHTEMVFQRQTGAEPGRALSVALVDYVKHHQEVRLRLLRKIIPYVTGPDYPPSEDKMIALDDCFLEALDGDKGGRRTLCGCCFEWRDGLLWIYREHGRLPRRLAFRSGDPVDWFGLYKVQVTSNRHEDKPLVFRALGEEGRAWLLQNGPRSRPNEDISLTENLGRFPAGVVEALPSIWWNDSPIYVIDGPNVAGQTGFRVDCEEKNTKFDRNQTGT